MYSSDGVKLLKEDVEEYRKIRNSPHAKRQWWRKVKENYDELDTNKRYKIRFVALILESDDD